MDTVETGPIADALAVFQAECTTVLSSGIADPDLAHSQLLERLLPTSSKLALSEDKIAAIMISGHLRRKEAILALLLEQELRVLADSGPVSEVHINALTDRITRQKSKTRNYTFRDVMNDDCELRAFKRRKYRESKVDPQARSLGPVFAGVRARKLKCPKQSKS